MTGAGDAQGAGPTDHHPDTPRAASAAAAGGKTNAIAAAGAAGTAAIAGTAAAAAAATATGVCADGEIEPLHAPKPELAAAELAAAAPAVKERQDIAPIQMPLSPHPWAAFHLSVEEPLQDVSRHEVSVGVVGGSLGG